MGKFGNIFTTKAQKEKRQQAIDKEFVNAVKVNDIATVTRLLPKVNININMSKIDGSDGYNTPLMNAAEEGHTELAKLLIDAGANIEAKYSEYIQYRLEGPNRTPLLIATNRGHTEIVKMLVDKRSATSNQQAQAASTGSQQEIVTALMSAAEKGNTEAAKQLIEKVTNKGALLLTLLTNPMITTSAKIEIMNVLITAGVDINFRNTNGDSPLLVAVFLGDKDLVEQLINAPNVNLNITNNNNQTALMIAAAKNQRDIAEMLLNKGADINIEDNNDDDALMLAAANGNSDMVKLLLEKQPKITDKLRYFISKKKFNTEIQTLLEPLYVSCGGGRRTRRRRSAPKRRRATRRT